VKKVKIIFRFISLLFYGSLLFLLWLIIPKAVEAKIKNMIIDKKDSTLEWIDKIRVKVYNL